MQAAQAQLPELGWSSVFFTHVAEQLALARVTAALNHTQQHEPGWSLVASTVPCLPPRSSDSGGVPRSTSKPSGKAGASLVFLLHVVGWPVEARVSEELRQDQLHAPTRRLVTSSFQGLSQCFRGSGGAQGGL